MAGYKKTVKDLDPLWFITFDGDQIIGNTGVINNIHVIDEIGNTFGILHDEDVFFKGYYCGLASHIQPEQSLQASIRYGANMRNPMALQAKTSLAPCSYIEVPNQTPTLFDKDEFTMIWTMKKDQQPYPDWTWTGEVGNSDRIYRLDETILRIGNIVEFHTVYTASSTYANLEFVLDRNNNAMFTARSSAPFNNASGHSTLSIPYNVAGVSDSLASLCVLRWKNGVVEYIVNGHTIVKYDLKTLSSYDPAIHTIPNMMTAFTQGMQFDELTVFIGGKPTNEIRKTSPKWQTISRCEFDQIAMFNKFIKDEDIMRLYRRVWFRRNMYLQESPYLYARMDDQSNQLTSRTSVKLDVNSINGRITTNSDASTLLPRIQGKYIDEYGIRFPNGFIFPYTGSGTVYSSSINMANDFTLEFSIKGASAKRSTLFQIAEINGQHQIAMVANSNNRQYMMGWIDLYYGNGKVYSFRSDILDDKWHRVIIRKKGMEVDVYVDSTVHMKSFIMELNPIHPQVLTFGSGNEPNTDFPASFSEVIIYNKALTDIILLAHTNYDYLYRVAGQIVSGGQPVEMLVRVYSHNSGQLLAETWSDPLTGNYNVYLSGSEYVDLIVLDSIHETVKLRGIGVIDPSEVNDGVYTVP